MGTFLVGAVLTLILTLIIRNIYKDRKKGKCSGCSSCPGYTECESLKNGKNGEKHFGSQA